MTGILVLDRQSFFRRVSDRGRVAAGCVPLGLTGAEAFKRYRGFDGDAWPFPDVEGIVRDDGLSSPNDWPSVQRYMAEKDPCDAIALGGIGSTAPILGWRELGLELGYFHSQWSHYSVILNEILFGAHAELVSHAARLNANLLFASLEECQLALRDRNEVRLRGGDIEDEDVVPITIFAPI